MSDRTEKQTEYNILPADFSENIESINTDPKKAEITYAINTYLDSDIKENVIRNLEIFCEDMNYNISYLYVSAILNEFHDVQDASEIVLANDLEDERELSAVNSGDLIELLTYSELLQVEKEIKELKFTELFEDNQNLSNEIEKGIKSDMQEGEIAYEEVKGQSQNIFGATEELLTIIDGYDPGCNTDGNLIYQKGILTVSENFARYNAEWADRAVAIKIMAREKCNRIGVVALERQIWILQSEINDYIADSLSENNCDYQDILLVELENYFENVKNHYRSLGVSENDIELLTKDQRLSEEFLQIVDQVPSVSINDITEIAD